MSNPSSPKGGCNNPQTVFAPVLKNAQPRGKIASDAFKFNLSPHLSEKKFEPNHLPRGRVSFQGRVSFKSWEVGVLWF